MVKFLKQNKIWKEPRDVWGHEHSDLLLEHSHVVKLSSFKGPLLSFIRHALERFKGEKHCEDYKTGNDTRWGWKTRLLRLYARWSEEDSLGTFGWALKDEKPQLTAWRSVQTLQRNRDAKSCGWEVLSVLEESETSEDGAQWERRRTGSEETDKSRQKCDHTQVVLRSSNCILMTQEAMGNQGQETW